MWARAVYLARLLFMVLTPPRTIENIACCGLHKMKVKCERWMSGIALEEEEDSEDIEAQLLSHKFGSSTSLAASILVVDLEGCPIIDYVVQQVVALLASS